MAARYRIYGNLDSREAVALSTALVAKGLAAELVEETPPLALALAARSGRDCGPYLRTPEGFVLGDLHTILDWIERSHPDPALLPRSPVRRVCARYLEDWIDFWLPLWPRRSWRTVIDLGAHLASAGFLLGAAPTRPDWLLAAWLETEVLVKADARAYLRQHAPKLLCFGNDVLEASSPGVGDDAIPISLLPVLAELACDFHGYLVMNQEALKDREDRVLLDLGLGKRPFPVRAACETRRIEIAEEVAALEPAARLDVRRVLEPLGAWHVLTLPAVGDTVDAADPRSL
jgi:glutathione S-transferase